MARTVRSLGSTKRLVLRAPSAEDFRGIVELWTDPKVTQHIGGPRPVQNLCDHFEQYAGDPERFFREEHEAWWSVVEGPTRRFAGLCSLLWKEVEGRTEVDLGYFLLPAYWGRGYATEAGREVISFGFRDLHLKSLIAIIHPENRMSRAVAQRLGMHLEQQVLRSDGVERMVFRLWAPRGQRIAPEDSRSFHEARRT